MSVYIIAQLKFTRREGWVPYPASVAFRNAQSGFAGSFLCYCY
jgi:hypothetical protein